MPIWKNVLNLGGGGDPEKELIDWVVPPAPGKIGGGGAYHSWAESKSHPGVDVDIGSPSPKKEDIDQKEAEIWENIKRGLGGGKDCWVFDRAVLYPVE